MYLRRVLSPSRQASLFLVVIGMQLSGCIESGSVTQLKPSSEVSGSSPGSQKGHIQVSWSRNREKAVNATGGGYRVYYSQNPSFSVPSGSVLNVPFVSGSYAPNSVAVKGLSSGYWYFRIVAYSAQNPSGSVASSPSSVWVP